MPVAFARSAASVDVLSAAPNSAKDDFESRVLLMPAGNVGLANRAKNGGHGFVQQIVAPAVRNRPIEQHQHKEFARPFGPFALQAEARRNIGSGRSPCVSFEDPFLDGLENKDFTSKPR